MNNKSATTLKYLFKQADYPQAVKKAQDAGIEIHEDEDKIYACACFDNTHDYNSFKEHFTQAVTA